MKAATCTEDGNIEYYTCPCGACFSDEKGEEEISAESVVIKADGHKYQWVIDKPATDTRPGYQHEECTVCGDRKPPVEIPATGTDDDDDDGSVSGGSGSRPSVVRPKPANPKPVTGDKGETNPNTGAGGSAAGSKKRLSGLAMSVLGATAAIILGRKKYSADHP